MTEKLKKSLKIIPLGKKKCVWMESGVISYKLCDNNYDCPTCAYDHAMQVKIVRHKEIEIDTHIEVTNKKITSTWIDKMMILPANKRKCRYMITGEVNRKLCPNAYECGTCSFDQMMQERFQLEPVPACIKEVAGFKMADGYYYHEGHTWARPEYGGRVRVGLDDFAQKLTGSISDLELPDIGTRIKQGETGFKIINNGHKSEALAPVDGIITFINKKLIENSSLVNESPYEEGWLFIIEPTKLQKNLKILHFSEDAHKFLNEEKEHLFLMANEDMMIAADGGISVDNLQKEIGTENWIKLIQTFLRVP